MLARPETRTEGGRVAVAVALSIVDVVTVAVAVVDAVAVAVTVPVAVSVAAAAAAAVAVTGKRVAARRATLYTGGGLVLPRHQRRVAPPRE